MSTRSIDYLGLSLSSLSLPRSDAHGSGKTSNPKKYDIHSIHTLQSMFQFLYLHACEAARRSAGAPEAPPDRDTELDWLQLEVGTTKMAEEI